MAFRKLYLGVDGGGSNTRSLLVDSRFSPVGSGKALGCNPHNCGYKKAGNRIDESIANAIDSLDSMILRSMQSIAELQEFARQKRSLV